MVLSNNTLRTFKAQDNNGTPTETIPLQNFFTVKSADNYLQKQFTFRLESQSRTFYFCASEQAEKENWIGLIGRSLVKPSVMRAAKVKKMH